jgi:hypothetical protein
MLTASNEIDYERYMSGEVEQMEEEFDDNVEILGLEPPPIDYEKLYQSDESDDDIEIVGLAA